MTGARWQQVKDVIEAVWEHDASGRAPLLDGLCARDHELRALVEKLLDSEESIGDFLMESAVEVPPPDDTAPDLDIASSGERIGTYRIVREIGRGGMGTVYLAERADGEYRKQVAIKLVAPGLAIPDILERFRTERQVLAELDHPHIARLLDGGVTPNGLPYFVMEYVAGPRIDIWCDRRNLPVRDRVSLFEKVCAAVEYAHERQVIHRDVKPANVLVTDEGTPKLLDFGVAKVLHPGTGKTLTGSRPAPLTPEYASPEQRRDGAVTPASDVYSLGVTLCRVLTGSLPEPAEKSVEWRRLAGDLRHIIRKALQPNPENRYASAGQLAKDLDRFLLGLPVLAHPESVAYRMRKFLRRNRVPAVAVSVAAVLLAVSGIRPFVKRGATMQAGPPSLAVLPFENLSGDGEQEYFADGMTDALISDLAQVHDLRVISRTSVMSFKGVRPKLPEIARQLGVQTIAEGAVVRTASRVRIVVRLVDARDSALWSRSYEGELKDVLSLQNEVAEAIASEIHASLTVPARVRASRSRPIDVAAYDAYLKGRRQYFTGLTESSARAAIDWFRKALAYDPDYAPAYAGLADCYYGLSNVYERPSDAMPKAKEAALKAIGLDATLAPAHAMLALVRSLYDFDRVGAESEFRRALELAPGDAQAHLWYGLHLVGLSRVKEALVETERARELDPISPEVSSYVGLHLYLSHQYDQVIERMTHFAEMNPGYHHPHVFMGLAYEQKGDFARAVAEMEKAYALDKEPEALAQLGHVYAVSGKSAQARNVLRELKRLSHGRYVSAYDFAVLYAGLGERDEAFRWLQQVGEDRSEFFAAVNVDPRLAALHTDPRWPGILRSVGLAK